MKRSNSARMIMQPKQSCRAVVRSLRCAFTLIEVLVVIALTILLFGLLLRPLISALGYTRQAQSLAAAQDSARKVLETMSRELGTAMYVTDNLSHPFVTSGTAGPAGTDLYTNFLDLEIPTAPNNRTVAHAYNAKLDYIMPRHRDGQAVDPTTGEPIQLSANKGVNGSAIISGTQLQMTLAPGTTMVRVFVGLKDPTAPYSNTNERFVSSGSTANNTYVLYRAQFPVYDSTTGGVNQKLFQPVMTSQSPSTPVTPQRPELDDPDFFRYVKAGTDVNWLSPDHHTYSNSEMVQHNTRVDNWVKIAKPLITAPEIDLLVLPRDADGNIAFDTTGSLKDVAHYGAALDPVPNAAANPFTGTNQWPVVKTSVTFAPAMVPTQAIPATASGNESQGQPVSAFDTSYGFVPAVYQADQRSWTGSFNISLYPGNYTNGQPYYITAVNYADLSSTTGDLSGDVIEYRVDTNGARTPVYNITQGHPEYVAASTKVQSTSTYVPLRIDPDKGTIIFSIRGMPPLVTQQATPTPTPAGWPNSYGNASGVYWYFGAADVNVATVTKGVGQAQIDLTHIADGSGNPDSPLESGYGPDNAHITPGSVRVLGPDDIPGPNLGSAVPYSEVSGLDTPGPNQFKVDYATGILTFHPIQTASGVGSDLPVLKADNATSADPVQVSFDYQANLTGTDPTNPVSASNPALPMIVNLAYSSRDTIDLNIGVRVYTPGTSRAQIITNDAKVRVGNSNR